MTLLDHAGCELSSHETVSHQEVSPSSRLTMADHYAVCILLKDLSKEDIIELGEALGLYYPHLRKMERLLKDMVAAWLNREDHVLLATGDPSWASLIQALRDIDQPGIAQRIAEGIII